RMVFIAFKTGRGRGGFAGASPQRAATANPTKHTGLFSMQPFGLWHFFHFSALLARTRSLRILPLRSRLEKWKNCQQQIPWDLISGSLAAQSWFVIPNCRAFFLVAAVERQPISRLHERSYFSRRLC